MTTAEFRCTYCREIVEEDQSALPKKDSRLLLAKFNEQLEPLYILLREVEGIKLSPEILEPEPVDINTIRGSVFSYQARRELLIPRDILILDSFFVETQHRHQEADRSSSAGGTMVRRGDKVLRFRSRRRKSGCYDRRRVGRRQCHKSQKGKTHLDDGEHSIERGRVSGADYRETSSLGL